jgi:DNA-binding LacI/PurR family transcriptional regulator
MNAFSARLRGLEEPLGEVAAGSELGDGDVDGPDPRIPPAAAVAVARVRAFLAALAVWGVAGGLGDEALALPGEYTEEGARGVAALTRAHKRPTAIFAANDLAAVGALHALENVGLKIPEDVSLVGYDNTGLAALGHIDLTTIDQPRLQMGATAVTLLLDRLDGRRHRARHVMVPPTLVVRGTTSPPPRRRGASSV